MDESTIRVRPLETISLEMAVPGDKSVSHRAAILAGLANGPCRVTNFLPAADCQNTLRAMGALGVDHEVVRSNDYGPVDLLIYGRSMELKRPTGPIDCGNSGTGMRLLAGVLAGQKFKSVLQGDESLSSRPMDRIIAPLEKMGAQIVATGDEDGCAPLEITGGPLKAIDYEMPVASAQVKSAIMLAGLFADGKTTVIQPDVTRDHTERMLSQFRVRSVTNGLAVSVYGGQMPEAVELNVPGDISSAAFWIVAAAAMPDSRLLIKDVGLNPTRTAILSVLVRMGARIKDVVRSGKDGEVAGNIEVQGGALKGTELRPGEIPNLIDEIPVIAVAGALAQGVTVIRHARELRVKETDRISAVVENLRALGAEVSEFEDGMEIEGGRPLRGTTLDSFGDHRIAMAFAVAGLFSEGETVIRNTDCIGTSYPGFQKDLERIRSRRKR